MGLLIEIGKVDEFLKIVEIFKQDGAKSVAVTSGKNSREYFQSQGFKDIDIRLMIREN